MFIVITRTACVCACVRACVYTTCLQEVLVVRKLGEEGRPGKMDGREVERKE